MFFDSALVLWLIIVITVNETLGVSYNLPKLCSNATWNGNALTFANKTTVHEEMYGLFVDTNNTVYTFDYKTVEILVWENGNREPTRRAIDSNLYLYSIFVTEIGNIYVSYSNKKNKNYAIGQFTPSNGTLTNVLDTEDACGCIFIDTNNSLYCSMYDSHKVIKKWLNLSSGKMETVAGTGGDGDGPKELKKPWGIFVDINFDLYVADSENNRIQLFKSGNLIGITKVGKKSKNKTFNLNWPTGVILDAEKNLFISEWENSRIIGSDKNGFRCIAACDGKGSGSEQLKEPSALSFDSYGNIYVIDYHNERIQKFLLSTNSCNYTTTASSMTTAISTTRSEPISASSPVQSTGLQTTAQSTRDKTTSLLQLFLSITSVSNLMTPSTHHALESSTVGVSTLVTSSPTSSETRQTPTSDIRSSEISSTLSQTSQMLSTEKIKSSAVPSSTSGINAPTTSDGKPTSVTPKETHVDELVLIFEPIPCPDSTKLGKYCNSSASICDLRKPCLNDGNCTNTNNNQDYTCLCPAGFTGNHCETKDGPCKVNTCINGACNETSDKEFYCTCTPGWEGLHCDRKIDYCKNVTCMNNGICRSSHPNYTCDCLGSSYYGRHCEFTTTKLVVYKMISKSFAYIAIIAIVSVILFVVIMDILKYVFGIDPTREELQRIRREKRAKRRRPVVQKFVYVNPTSLPSQAEDSSSNTHEETTV
ncbi:unnamed protein product [Adineta ricciae]|uniref:EGF-like domain-containing protein n=1 Tax=Adineta ricciae TaxID=249248 RepID=A0A814PIU5_ADIRI|nr:unnamed protein product [Adineta ricciae]CAF1106050.1 unnamed protein product [Adineta ricciae]